MRYEEWLESIEILNTNNDEKIKNKLLMEEENLNIQDMVEPKLISLIKNKFSISINNIINSVEDIFSDSNALDMKLIKFKKDVMFIYELTNIKQIKVNNQESLKNMLKNESEKVYEILLKKATNIDVTGVLGMTIKNNEIKWSDNNEL